jgi:hypothetical protein
MQDQSEESGQSEEYPEPTRNHPTKKPEVDPGKRRIDQIQQKTKERNLQKKGFHL